MGRVKNLLPGAKGIDSAGKPDLRAVKAAGYEFVIVYFSIPVWPYSTWGVRNPKDWTRAYLDWCGELGLGALASVEQSSGTMLGGYSERNKDLIKAATDGAAEVGYPPAAPFIMNNDTDAYTDWHWYQSQRAWDAYEEGNSQHHGLGLYSGDWLREKFQATGRVSGPYWDPVFATSWDHGRKAACNINQYAQITFGGVKIDTNMLMTPTAMYFPGEVEPPHIPPIEKPPADPLKDVTEMPMRHTHIRMTEHREIYYSNGIHMYHIPTELGLLQSLFETGAIGDDEWAKYMRQKETGEDLGFDLWSYVTVVDALDGYGTPVG